MKPYWRLMALVLLVGVVVATVAEAAILGAASSTTSTSSGGSPPGVGAAKALSTITGIAISPLLGSSVLGAVDYFRSPSEKRDQLPWYCHPLFWVSGLLLVGAVAAKDAFGATVPPGLKKPLDVAEVVENKLTGLVAAGAVVPFVASIFHSSTASSALQPLVAGGCAAIDFTPLLNVLTIPFAVAAYALVWLLSHALNILILISPWGAVDAVLKAARTSLLGLLALVSLINPWIGALLSLVVIVVAYFLAGWSFRLMIFGSVFAWDFFTFRRCRHHPSPENTKAFAARKLGELPSRTYGLLVRGADGKLQFRYRPWLVGAERTYAVPEAKYLVGRGFICPILARHDADRTPAIFMFPPRCRTHETTLGDIYRLPVEDVGLLKGLKGIWKHIKTLFGVGEPVIASAAQASVASQ
jgi:MFS family permease